MQPRLSKGAIVELERRIDQMFDGLLTRLLGGHYSGKHLFIQTDPVMSIPGLFRAGVEEEGGTVDLDLLQNLADIVKGLVNKEREGAKATTVRRIQMLLEDVKAGRIQPEHFRNHVEGELTDTWGRISSNVERIVNTESQHALTIGLKDGIDQINVARGIDDAVVVFIPKQDAALCNECRKTHLIGTTPRCWYSSEVSSDYHVRGEDKPSWHRMHPHCRCSLATVLPGFGFDGGGRLTFIKDDFKELDYQRAVGEPLGGVDERRAWGELVQKSEEEVSLDLLKTDGSKRGFVRFGVLPKTGKSWNAMEGRYEAGVSVFDAVYNAKSRRWVLQVPEGTGRRTAEYLHRHGGVKNTEPHVVSGTILEQRGADNEPLLEDVGVIEKLPSHRVTLPWVKPVQKSEEDVGEPLGKVVIHDNEKRPATVFRVEDDNGLGPYDDSNMFSQGTSLKHDVPRLPEVYYENQPLPEDDFPPHENNEGLEEGYAFGFEHPSDAVRWFGRGGLHKLSEAGYHLRAVPASKIIRSGSGRQVMFRHHKSYKSGGKPIDPDTYTVLQSQMKKRTLKKGDIAKPHYTQTPEFKSWFGDWEDPKAFTSRAKGPVSKVFDHENKRPLTLYHATHGNFSTFEVGRPTVNSTTFGPYETQRHAVFATPDAGFAHEYLDPQQHGGNVMPVHMSIHSPFDLTSVSDSDVDDLANYGINPRWVRNTQNSWELFDGEDGANFVRGLQSAGYDGAFMHETKADGTIAPVWVAFHPHQVKSATGNVGSFDPTNPDILKSNP